ncbi:molybdopterin molybdotransferase MoeA [Bdellovibrionota bacterium FG-2]
MLSYTKARGILTQVAQSFGPWGVESVSLDQSLGRVLATDLFSPEAVPSFDNSAMDGFAVNALLTFSASPAAPLKLKALGCISAGDAPICVDYPAAEGGVFEIMTGAPMPVSHGSMKFDGVVKIEDVELVRDAKGNPQEVILRKALKPGENVRFIGEDFKREQQIGEKGRGITPECIMAFASLGIAKLEVLRKPKVIFLSTGRELVDLDTGALKVGLKPGTIRNSSAPYLEASLKTFGAQATFFGNIQDDAREFERVLDRVLAEKPDVVLTTGAVSMGKFDFVAQVLEKKGAEVFFHKVKIRPGKPILFAKLGNVSFFGVPGNPVSTAVGLRFFVVPFLRNLMGLKNESAIWAKLEGVVKKPPGLECFYKAQLRVSAQDGQARVKILQGQASFMVSPLLEANAWAVLPESIDVLREGELLEVYPLQATLSGGGVFL